jgi:hypothetical protein
MAGAKPRQPESFEDTDNTKDKDDPKVGDPAEQI